MIDFVDIDEMDNLRDMLEELYEIDHGLSGYEMNFIQSLSEWDGCFTTKQAETLEKFYERHC